MIACAPEKHTATYLPTYLMSLLLVEEDVAEEHWDDALEEEVIEDRLQVGPVPRSVGR